VWLGSWVYRLSLVKITKFGEKRSDHSEVEDVNIDRMTKRLLHSWCGRLTSHYPIAAWLRNKCSFIKQISSSVGWDSEISDAAKFMASELLSDIKKNDPCCGIWSCDIKDGVSVYVDASKLSMAAIVRDSRNNTIEDQCWSLPLGNSKHINTTELESVIRGISLAAKWEPASIHVYTDSKTTCSWVESVINNKGRVKVSGLHEQLIQRRLDILHDFVEISKIKISISWIPSEENPADLLTRVPSSWMKMVADEKKSCAAAAAAVSHHDDDDDDDAVEVNDVPVLDQLDQSANLKTIRVPPNDLISVAVVDKQTAYKVATTIHRSRSHPGWQALYGMVRRVLYTVNLASLCQEICQKCIICSASHTRP
jgi:ribonuclease HI